MKKIIRWTAVGLLAVFATIQLVQPERVNPQTVESRAIQAFDGMGQLTAILDRSCRDCHSNDTEWSWYSRVAPLSWLMALSVSRGRSAVNFSEWSQYSPEVRHALLSATCADVRAGRMPGPYTLFRPKAKLSSKDIETICAAAQR